MSVVSGKYAEALVGSCNILEFEAWDLEYGSNIEEYNARSGGGATQTEAGVEGGSGTLTCFVDPDNPLPGQVASGALVTLTLRHTATGPVVWTGQARIGKWSTGGNRDGSLQKITAPFTTHGVWTPPT